jgi:hypothetical protein
MFAEFVVETFYSKARCGNWCIAGYETVFVTPLLDKTADQKTANMPTRRIADYYLK